MARTQYRSQASADIRELLTQLNETKILPYGYPTQLAKKTGCTIGSARNTVQGRSAKIEVVEAVIEDAEKLLKIKATKPPKLDYSDWSISKLVQEKILPNRYGELASEMTGLSPNTIQQIKSGSGASKKAETALRKLAGDNLELEMKHRLERILEAIHEESPTA